MRTCIASQGSTETLFDLVTRDVVKAVEAPELPSQAGCPVLGQMGT